MAGLYLHIPFCKQKCSYCDFHFSTSINNKPNLVEALIKEIKQKKELLKDEISTIYFGGGTPSLLNIKELNDILNAIHQNYNVSKTAEFTFECNPDDLTQQKLSDLRGAGVNRLSIGTQSFFDEDLLFFNRAHNSEQAERSIKLSQDLGFDNITIDLIYNTPTLTMDKWEQNLNKMIALNVPHLSAYTLTVEPNTLLHHQVKTQQTSLPSDEEAIAQFKLLMQLTKESGLTQYEVSNFGKEGYYSKHNSNYWKGIEYLGIGPSAHSFYDNKRSWNVSNNTKYIKALQNDDPFCEEETIDSKTAYNEYVLTRLRTIWGIDLNFVSANFDEKINKHFNKELTKYLKTPYLKVSKNIITLTQEGIFIADKISSDLFYIT